MKPHGALYNQAQRDSRSGQRGCLGRRAACYRWSDCPAVCWRSRRATQWPYVAEGFPDRRYRADGSLVPRIEPDAVLHDPAEIEAQVLRLVNEGRVATLCIHGDDPRAVANAELVRGILTQHGIAIRSFLDEST